MRKTTRTMQVQIRATVCPVFPGHVQFIDPKISILERFLNL